MKPGFWLVLAALSSLALAVSASSLPSPLGDIQLGGHSMPGVQTPRPSLPAGFPDTASSLPVFVKPSAPQIPDLSPLFGQQSAALQEQLSALNGGSGVFAKGKLDLSAYMAMPRIGAGLPGPARSPQDFTLIPSNGMKTIKSSATPGNWQNAWSGWQ